MLSRCFTTTSPFSTLLVSSTLPSSPPSNHENWTTRLLAAYSPQQEMKRIRLAEGLFRAAQDQAYQPYVCIYKDSCIKLIDVSCLYMKEE